MTYLDYLQHTGYWTAYIVYNNVESTHGNSIDSRRY